MGSVYSTYEAKAKLSEIIRKVREGGTVVITYRGRPVAEVRPTVAGIEGLEARLARLERTGVVAGPRRAAAVPHPVARRDGALVRFLESRE